jgi:Rrf2 family protein
MKLSNGVEWGLHCCVTLSQAREPVPSSLLAELHDIPAAYLAKQLQALSRAGVVRSSQGQEGGYSLASPASQITVLDVVTAIDGPGEFFHCAEIRARGPLAVPPEQCADRCAISRAMASAEQVWRQALSTVTIADLATSIDMDSDGTALGDVGAWLRTR